MHATLTLPVLLLALTFSFPTSTSASLTPVLRGSIPAARSLADLPELSAESSEFERDYVPEVAPHVALLDRAFEDAGYSIEKLMKRGADPIEVINEVRHLKFNENTRSLHKRQTTTPTTPTTNTTTPTPVKLAPILGATGCKQLKKFALSFDDGVYDSSLQLAQRIKKVNGTASFFLNGYNWRCTYNLADKLVAIHKLGHFLGNHGWSHAHSDQLTYEQMHLQLKLVEDMFSKILGFVPIYFRPPYGAYNELTQQVAAERGYKGLILWDFDSGDTFWPRISTEEIMARYQARIDAYPNSTIALNHDVQAQTTSEVMPQLIPKLVAKRFKFASIPECLATGADPSKWYRKTTGKYGKRDATWTCDGTPAPGSN